MAYKDGEVFQTYCDKSYDKHKYKIVFKNGKSITYDDYEMMRIIKDQLYVLLSTLDTNNKFSTKNALISVFVSLFSFEDVTNESIHITYYKKLAVIRTKTLKPKSISL